MAKVIFKFEDLKVYQKSIDFVDMVYKMCQDFPRVEKYGLVSQYTRSASSIALNIAEGSTDTDAQFIRFLQIARGSVMECVVCSEISKRQGYISYKTDKLARKKLEELSKMLTSLQKYLRSKKDQSNL